MEATLGGELHANGGYLLALLALLSPITACIVH